MLPQEHRLKHKRDFDTLFSDGRFLGGKFVTIKYWPIDPKKFPRRAYKLDDLKIGFVVGLKISKRAVDRNRLKRQMREIVRLLLKEGRIKKGFLVAVLAKQGSIGVEYNDLEKDMSTLLERAKILSKQSS